LAGFLGNLLVPRLMAQYQTPDERELDPQETAARFRHAGFACQARFYDFVSTPLAGLLPGWRAGYQTARVLDELLVRIPGWRRLGSNFEIVATRERFPA
ncbi:MAG: hypothetical protein HYX27_24885, partial [Acidobacteria bacterium]|nr:hypothetical protein [Acidobacteriota bacterium]